MDASAKVRSSQEFDNQVSHILEIIHVWNQDHLIVNGVVELIQLAVSNSVTIILL